MQTTPSITTITRRTTISKRKSKEKKAQVSPATSANNESQAVLDKLVETNFIVDNNAIADEIVTEIVNIANIPAAPAARD